MCLEGLDGRIVYETLKGFEVFKKGRRKKVKKK